MVETYKNDHKLKGKALIININKYDGDFFPERLGSHVSELFP